MSSERIFKVLGEDDNCYYGGLASWFIPVDSQPAPFMPQIPGPLVPCQSGYHLCREDQLVFWVGPRIYLAEYRGELVEDEQKIVVREARLLKRLDTWNPHSAAHFAMDCAYHVLPLFHAQYSEENRPREALTTLQRYLSKDATRKELQRAWIGVRDAIWRILQRTATEPSIAWAGHAVVNAVGLWACYTLTDIAWSACMTAQAARYAVDERTWQTAKLMEYLFPIPCAA